MAHEIVQLKMLGHVGMVEMVGTHFQTMTVSLLDVAKVCLVLCLLAFCGLEIYVGHVAVVAQCLPPHVALVMAHVQAVDVVACVFTLNPIRLGTNSHGREDTDQ